MANTVEFFSNSQGVQAERIKFVTNISSPAGVGPLEKLEGRIAVGAIHDSAERCDAPKCHPETRVAVQDDLYDWIVDGDGAVEYPRRIKWMTGPAGSGKTAIMGSLAERCAADGILGATFFFASWSSSIGRRRKTALVTTIAHQLARHHHDLRDGISKAIDANLDIFDKRLHAQMEVLVLGPLKNIAGRPNAPGLRGVIIVDGLDECEAEQYHDAATIASKSKPTAPRTNAQDQLEILQVLHQASLDPNFPFRILIVSRPERVFREFFDPERDPASFSLKLDLNEDYNADADISLFLEAQFNRISRRYNLPPSWPPSESIQTLVNNASGQFIYAVTVIRFLDDSPQAPPDAQLQSILGMRTTPASNPLEQLDALYLHVLKSSANSALSVRWICAIKYLNDSLGIGYNPLVGRDVEKPPCASHMNLFLQTETGEVEHLLGNLHSLIRIPNPSEQATGYAFHHQSLLDFLKDPDRCGSLYVEEKETFAFIMERYVRLCTKGCNTQFSYPETFLDFVFSLIFYPTRFLEEGVAHSKVIPTPASADWWVSLAISRKEGVSLWYVFQAVHHSGTLNATTILSLPKQQRMTSYFAGAQNFHDFDLHIVNVTPSVGPLEKLESRIAAGAIHDSAERCDAPKCHPDTRVAVQDDLYGWIVDGDGGSEPPRKIKWVTGPAGTGKTAVMGSLAERCAPGGLLAATFFFASWSVSIGRRRKTAFIATIAHQLAQHQEDLNNAISDAIERNPGVFDKNLQVQMEVLVLAPLREIAGRPDRPVLRGAIIIDGLDECEAEQYHDTASAASRGTKPGRTNAQDQLEILQVLRTASSDPSFPFRIVIASRPERVFREFFDPESNHASFSPKLDLHEDYNAEADIALFLKAHLNRIRRRYNLSSSWPPPETIETLVENASGQFIYAATVIRFLDESPHAPPDAQLRSILEMRTTPTSNPLEQLDALYSHIISSSPTPAFSVRWIRAIIMLGGWVSIMHTRHASHVNVLLQTESGEAEHLLGALHSLVRIPPPSDQDTTQYNIYHKSFTDFLKDPNRCGDLFVDDSDIGVFLWDRFVRACANEPNDMILKGVETAICHTRKASSDFCPISH
ncbi:hypothetical protein EST38_g6258 [Candolleomyces aberdarensis]|uniref:Nephrocystin 3-like N-terminal domain-containing protein n=1 Tax=Candolleomyces aberdarensis TaxID=2316362 RepID=A0A4Q2DK74_9AGAR|nr:hypothetical protein EST38_g6258 [Candolleomyces aberdarensis]